MNILDYSVEDLQFAHWMAVQRRDIGILNLQSPDWLTKELDRLRPLRNPNASIFILDTKYGNHLQ
jgi:hypothetical protein